MTVSKPETIQRRKENSRKRMAHLYKTDPAFRAKILERNRIRWATNPEFRASQNAFKRKYRGMPEPTRPYPEYCEGCGCAPGKRSLHLDHCHQTGIFRGWLCSSCNTGLGMIGDSIESVEKILAYLRRA